MADLAHAAREALQKRKGLKFRRVPLTAVRLRARSIDAADARTVRADRPEKAEPAS